MMIFLFSLLWIVIGVFNYGAWFGTFNERYPASYHGYVGAIASLLSGPAGIFVVLIVGNGYKHLEWKPRTKEQRWESHKKLYPYLSSNLTIDTFEK